MDADDLLLIVGGALALWLILRRSVKSASTTEQHGPVPLPDQVPAVYDGQ